MLLENNNCKHCELKLSIHQQNFCCKGCEKAYEIIESMGLKNYYQIREKNISEANLKPDLNGNFDISEFVKKNLKNNSSRNLNNNFEENLSDDISNNHKNEISNSWHLELMVQGLQCGACVWLIESILLKNPKVLQARINLTRKVLSLDFQGEISDANKIIHQVSEIGYKFLPFDQEIIQEEEKKYNNSLLKALGVAGFGAGNIMFFSFILWFNNSEEMGFASHQFLQFISALIALPVIIYSARIFFISAYKALANGFANMDVPISLAIILAGIVSLFQAYQGGDHVYFDSAVMLTFFLLIGRFLEMKARKKAFNIATEFSLLNASYARVEEEKVIKILPIKKLQKDMILVISCGEKIASDGIVIEGESEIDDSLLTGEIILKKIAKDSMVYAGSINISQPIKVRITSDINSNLLSQIIALINQNQNSKNSCELIAQKLSKIYTPLVHILAFLTFVIWFLVIDKSFTQAIMNATAVLIITCPCALALAIPIVQTIVISGFITKQILVKNGEALEKINKIDMVIFDKTGSLTLGTPRLKSIYSIENNSIKKLEKNQEDFYLTIAVAMAKNSSHPISKALLASCPNHNFDLVIHEEKSQGLSGKITVEFLKQIINELKNNKINYQLNEDFFRNFNDQMPLDVRLGRSQYCNINFNNFQEILSKYNENYQQLTTFMKLADHELVFVFDDEIKQDAYQVISFLKSIGKKIILLSGDHQKNVEIIAQKLGIKEFYYQKSILQKAEFLENMKKNNDNFMMIGDGLNDAPALAISTVSVSFTNASDLSKNIADILINSTKLSPIISLFIGSKKAFQIMKQNLLLALIYNLIALPFAVMGMVMPLIAAISMSSSSLLVILNSLRINKFFKNKNIKCQS